LLLDLDHAAFQPRVLETAIMSEKMARNALSRTESDSEFLAIAAIPSAAQVQCLVIRPTARSIVRRRKDSTVLRTMGSFAHL
jgi:hypothetical protein